MILYPAIDLKDGQVVRLKQGRFDEVTVYSEDPLAMAEQWVAAGAEWLHVVDLNGALEGKPVNTSVIETIMQGVEVPVQIGGGIRSQDTAEIYLTLGAGRIVLGTKALEEPALVEALAKEFPDRIAVGIDAKDGKVAVRGWKETADQNAVEVGKQLAALGAACIIYTDITRDGMLTGPNFEATQTMARESGLPVIASGGIASIDDIKRLKEMESDGVVGAILGRSIYENKFDLTEAIKLASS